MESGIELKELPDVNYETFALATASLPDWDAEKAAEWYAENTRSLTDKIDYAVLAMDSQMDVPGDGVWSASGLGVAGLVVPEFPLLARIDCVFRVVWGASDIGRTEPFTIVIPDADELDEPVITIEDIISNGLPSVIESGHSHHGGGGMPIIYQFVILLALHKVGIGKLAINSSEGILREFSLRVDQATSFPDRV